VSIFRKSEATTAYLPVRVTDTDGRDISAAPIKLGYSQDPEVEPTTWYTPDAERASGSVTVRIPLLLIGPDAPAGRNPAAGEYYTWYWLTDTPEVYREKAGTFTVTPS